MATQEQIAQIAALLQETHPARFFTHVDQSRAGIGAVMRLLSQSKEPVTAGNISEFLNVSTARVAVLLKKMEAKGLIVRKRDPFDARVTLVCLSESGEQMNAHITAEMQRRIGDAIDKIGMERMLEFVTIAKEIHDSFSDAEEHLQVPCEFYEGVMDTH